jgi:hypothetical protein
MANTDDDKIAAARSQAMAQYASIAEMVAKLRAADDDDAYAEMAKELATDAGFRVTETTDDEGNSGWCWGKDRVDDGTTHDDEDAAWLACCDDNGLRPDSEEARREIEEDALSVQVRSGWCSPGEKMEAEQFEVLLCTGGPAVRIMGELSEHCEPTRAWMECQDWFTPWTEVHSGIDQDTLLAYCGCFYFGE